MIELLLFGFKLLALFSGLFVLACVVLAIADSSSTSGPASEYGWDEEDFTG